MIKDVAEKILGYALDAESGLKLEEIEKAEARLGFRLPFALREYYMSVGNVAEFMYGHNVFAPLEEIYADDEMLYFLEENQSVCMWAIKLSELTYDNPEIYMVSEMDEGNEFYPEDLFLPEFLRLMMYYQICQGESEAYPYLGYIDEMSPELSYELLNWEKTVEHNSFVVYFKEGTIIYYTSNDGQISDVLCLARDAGKYNQLKELYSFEDH